MDYLSFVVPSLSFILQILLSCRLLSLVFSRSSSSCFSCNSWTSLCRLSFCLCQQKKVGHKAHFSCRDRLLRQSQQQRQPNSHSRYTMDLGINQARRAKPSRKLPFPRGISREAKFPGVYALTQTQPSGQVRRHCNDSRPEYIGLHLY